MLRLIQVNLKDIDVLSALIEIAAPSEAASLMEALKWLSEHLNTQKEGSSVRMVLSHVMHRQMLDVINFPFLPVDAAQMGIPEDVYLKMIGRIPHLRQNISLPDLMDPSHLDAGMESPKISKTYLN